MLYPSHNLRARLAARRIVTKAYAPDRVVPAGHTGVMVALYPDPMAALAIAAQPGVTEAADQLHLTLCYLGNSSETHLAQNKARLIDCLALWAAFQWTPQRGTINGLGRFFHTEDDGTNAVYVAPDLPALPALRQSLIAAIEAAGFDYSQTHGFTPHITVAYVPAGALTPDIRIETPVTFDRLVLCWGDAQFDFPIRSVTKAANYGAKVGQTIAGRLTRGAGGRFSSSGAPATPAKRSPAQQAAYERGRQSVAQQRRSGGGGKGRAKKPKAPTKAPKPAREETRAANRQAVIDAMAQSDSGLQPAAAKALLGFADGQDAGAFTDGLISAGLMQRGQDGTPRLTEAGRNTVSAMNRGDTRTALDAIGRGADRAAKLAETPAPKGGGGGSGKATPSEEAKKAEETRKKTEQRTKTAPQAGISVEEAEFLAGAASGTLPPGSFDAKRLMQLGLVADAGDTTEATDAGRRALAALERGDVRGALAAIQDGKASVARGQARQATATQRAADTKRRDAERTTRQQQTEQRRQARAAELERRRQERAAKKNSVATKAQRTFGGTPRGQLADSAFALADERKFPIKTAQDVRDAARLAGHYKGPKSGRAVRAAIRRRAQRIGALSALPESWKGAGLSVVKQADGRYRWLMVSSTAYEDRDREWVSKAALALDVARADRTGAYGPLWWWHTPYVIGTCDFNAVAGPLLYESGTFLDEQTALAVAKEADTLGGSLDFKRLPWEPIDRTFTFIRRVGRSLLPKIRASNLFTDLVVYKETHMDEEKLTALAALLGIGPDDARAMVAKQLTQTKAAAAAAGLVEKAASEMPSEEDAAADDTMPPAAKQDAPAAGELGMEEAPADDGGPLFTPEELTEIAQAVAPIVAQAVIEQLGPALNMEAKLAKYADEMKGLVGGMFTQKDDAAATERARVDALATELTETKERLATLEGDQPGAFHRPSLDGANTGLGAVIKEALAQDGDAADPFEKFMSGLKIAQPTTT